LTGCNNAEDKIVDLSGGVFLVYVVLVGMKLATPRIVNLTIYKKSTSFLSSHISILVYPLYILAAALTLTGFLMGGIHKVHIFSGFILAFIAYNFAKLSTEGSNEENKTILEIITLGTSILFVLFLLWGLGTDLFKGL
jgi:hypothetical protein